MDSTTDLAAVVRSLVAQREIIDAVQRYMRGLDRLDRASLIGAFHPDAFMDCGIFSGNRDDFVDFALNLLSGMAATHHMLGQTRIEVHEADGASGRASGECYFQAFHDLKDEHGEVRDLFISGRYVDEYVFDGGWTIFRRRLITDWASDRAGSRSYFSKSPASPRGARRGADFSQTRDWASIMAATRE